MQALPASALSLQHFFDRSSDLIAAVSMFAETWHSVNPAFERCLGWSREELAGESLRAIISPGDLAQWRVATGELTCRVRCKDGSHRWIAWHIFAPEDDGLAYCIGRELTDSVGPEAAQAFLLRLSDALRPLGDPIAVQEVAQRLLGEHLGASRICYAEDVGDGVHVELTRDWTRGVRSVAGRYCYADYGKDLLDALTSGGTCIRPDIEADPALSAEEKAAHIRLDVRAAIFVPLVKHGNVVAIFAVHYDRPHAFTPIEITVIEATAERTWSAVEHARAEIALKENEEKYRDLFRSMDQGYCIIQLLYEGDEPVDWRFIEVNPAFEKHNPSYSPGRY